MVITLKRFVWYSIISVGYGCCYWEQSVIQFQTLSDQSHGEAKGLWTRRYLGHVIIAKKGA